MYFLFRMVPSPLLSSFPVQCDLNGNYLHKTYFTAFECIFIAIALKLEVCFLSLVT